MDAPEPGSVCYLRRNINVPDEASRVANVAFIHEENGRGGWLCTIVTLIDHLIHTANIYPTREDAENAYNPVTDPPTLAFVENDNPL